MSNNFFSFFSSHKSSADPIKVLTPEMFAFLEQLPSVLLLLDEAGKIACKRKLLLSTGRGWTALA